MDWGDEHMFCGGSPLLGGVSPKSVHASTEPVDSCTWSVLVSTTRVHVPPKPVDESPELVHASPCLVHDPPDLGGGPNGVRRLWKQKNGKVIRLIGRIRPIGPILLPTPVPWHLEVQSSRGKVKNVNRMRSGDPNGTKPQEAFNHKA